MMPVLIGLLVLLLPVTAFASVEDVKRAIRLSAPDLSTKTASTYARVIVEEASRHRIDPMTIVALVTHESQFHASAVGGPSKDDPMIGLGQIRARNHKACALDLESEDCKQHVGRLLHGPTNLRAVARAVVTTREFCRRYKGTATVLTSEWLFQYGGFGSNRGHCGWKKHPKKMQRVNGSKEAKLQMPRTVKDIGKYRDCLVAEVARGTKPSASGARRFSCWRHYRR